MKLSAIRTAGAIAKAAGQVLIDPVCMFNVCMYALIFVYTFTHVHLCVCVCVCMYLCVQERSLRLLGRLYWPVYVCMYVCICVYVRICILACMCVYMFVSHIYIHPCMHAHKWTGRHNAFTDLYLYAYIHVYI